MLSEETILTAIKTAESIAKRERQLAFISEQSNVSDALSARFAETLGDGMYIAATDKTVAALLPQAQNIVAMREARSKYLNENTLLGYFSACLDDIHTQYAHDEAYGEEAFDALEGKTSKEIMRSLQDVLESGDKYHILASLNDIIGSILNDLTQSELPPAAPPYDLSQLTD